jgi:hypothetical protein
MFLCTHTLFVCSFAPAKVAACRPASPCGFCKAPGELSLEVFPAPRTGYFYSSRGIN